MKGSLLLTIAAALVMGACQSKTVVYTSPSGATHTTSGGGTRVVNRTVYVNQPDDTPTSVPGASRKVPDAGAPDKFEAVSQ